MSFVTLILIKDQQLRMLSAHYRVIKNIIACAHFDFAAIKTSNHHFIDAGYILVDYDAKTIINAQDAFTPQLAQFSPITL